MMFSIAINESMTAVFKVYNTCIYIYMYTHTRYRHVYVLYLCFLRYIDKTNYNFQSLLQDFFV